MVAVLCQKCGCLIRVEPPEDDRRALLSMCLSCGEKKRRENKEDSKFRKFRKTKKEWVMSPAVEHRAPWPYLGV